MVAIRLYPFFVKYKLKFLKTFESNKNLSEAAEAFSKFNATADEIHAGQKNIAALHREDENKLLNVMRYDIFAKFLRKITFNLASLPLTAVARQYSLTIETLWT